MDDSEPIMPPPEPIAPEPRPAGRSTASDRAQRLASALRDNLKRRKAAGRLARSAKPSN